jgi:hypothetical protein
MAGEQVAHRTRLHWVALLGPAIVTAALVAATLDVVVAKDPRPAALIARGVSYGWQALLSRAGLDRTPLATLPAAQPSPAKRKAPAAGAPTPEALLGVAGSVTTMLAAKLWILLVTTTALAILRLLGVLVAFRSAEFAVTNKRVLIKVGVLRRRSLEILLSKVETISVDQPILGRLLGYGSLTVGGTGGTKEVFHLIRGPLEFRRHVQEQAAA